MSALLLAGGLWTGALDAQQPATPDPAAQTPAPPTPALDDAEFDKALPPLEQTAPATPAPTTEPPPPLVAPELQQPLPPLATFESTPAPTIGAEQGDAARQIPYTVKVEGLKPLELDDDFKTLSALLHDGKKAANATQIGARAQEDKGLAERLMRSEGYLDGTAIVTIPAATDPVATVPVTITATPGTRYKLGAITVTGAEPEPTRFARRALRLKTGDPIAAAAIEDSEARVALRLPEQGYPFAKVGQRDILIDGATATGDYTLPIESGRKARYGKLRTEGDPVFTLRHLNVFPRFDPGEIYDSRKVDDLRQALIGTSLLSTVSVEPIATGEVQPDGTELVDLLVRQKRGPARTLSATGGYGTGEGVKLTGSWEHRNFFPPEGALIVTALAGTQQQSLSTTFRRSDAGQRDRTFEGGLTVSRQRFDAYDAQSVTLGASIARQSTPIWQKRWTYSIGTELTATRETPFDALLATRPKDTYLIAALPLQGGYDTSNSLLDPTRGLRVNLKLSPEAQKTTTSGGGFDTYLRMLAETSTYRRLTRALVLAGRVRVGSIVGASRDSIAPSRRLYSGGGGSVRGFGYQQLGPKDVNGDPIGGRSLTEFAVEARYRFGNYGIVPFFDGGRVGEKSTPSISGMRYGVGIGARYYTNFGPFRIDVATPLNRQKGESKIGVYISIGQAF
ncbi:autotransporter assembly complex family protein [Sphingomonas sp. AP4-R1]|uniref:autotransporter assembly complex protein TamA n=1 Tax=Sphingomonas sp. AP4-R1 TaxID=2735134 RepID=UPI0020A50B98|nr:BamA/TamA family outer membrane protein [Sphingomonas sp. AP4-R1]